MTPPTSEGGAKRGGYEQYDRCYFCGDDIPCLISGMNICRECYDDAGKDESDGFFD